MSGSPIKLSPRAINGLEPYKRLLYSVYGPSARNVMVSDAGQTVFTNDGATILNGLYSEDRIENMLLGMIRSASNAVAKSVGDGTTFTALATFELLEAAIKYDLADSDFVHLESEWARDVLELAQYRIMPTRYHQIESVVRTTAKDPVIAKVVIDTISAIGKNGTILVDEGKATETTIEFQEGYSFAVKLSADTWLERMLKGDPVMEVLPIKVVFATDLKTPEELRELLVDRTPTLIFLTGLTKRVYAASLAWRDEVFHLLIPGLPERTLTDLKAYTAQGVSKAIIGPHSIRVFAQTNDNREVQRHVRYLASTIGTLNDEDAKDIRGRIADLMAATGTITLGGATHTEILSQRVRYEDAVMVANSVIDNGMVPGCGWALHQLTNRNPILRSVYDLAWKHFIGTAPIQTGLYPKLNAIAKTIEWESVPTVFDSYAAITHAVTSAISASRTLRSARFMIKDKTI